MIKEDKIKYFAGIRQFGNAVLVKVSTFWGNSHIYPKDRPLITNEMKMKMPLCFSFGFTKPFCEVRRCLTMRHQQVMREHSRLFEVELKYKTLSKALKNLTEHCSIHHLEMDYWSLLCFTQVKGSLYKYQLNSNMAVHLRINISGVCLSL